LNFAVLSKLRLISGNLDELVERIKIAIRQPGIHNLAEIAFYCSDQSHQEFYLLSFWFQLEDSQEAHNLIRAEFFKATSLRSKMVERHIFRLNWEYRLLTQTPAASHIRLLTFPDNYPEDKAKVIIEAARKRKPEIPGLLGSWIGRCLDNPQLTLQRVDWASLDAMEAFFNSKQNQDIIAERRAQGIQIDYTRQNLKEIIEYIPDTLYESTQEKQNQVALAKD
jgi:heme-degrading monooxygenase HmoA